RARILLTSQTHVAIDNALEWLATVAANVRMLRIARAGASVVSEVCHPYLVDNQLDRWRSEVGVGSSKWLDNWARSKNLDPDEIAAGAQLKRMVELRNNVARLRELIQDCEKKLEQAAAPEAPGSPENDRPDPETVRRDADEFRVQLDSDKKYLDQ